MSFTTLEQEILIRAPWRRLAGELFRVETFPEYMSDVQEVKIIERAADRQISAWRVNIDGVELAWSEEDRLFVEEGRMTYRIIKGDFEVFEGAWQSNAAPEHGADTTRVRLSVTYDLGLPCFEELIGEILAIKVKRNTESLLKALKRRAEEGNL